MTGTELTNIVVGVALVGLFLARQLRARNAREDSSLKLMLILGIIGLGDASDALKGHHLSAGAIAVLVLSLAVGAGLGALRGWTTRVWRTADGQAWRQGTWVTAALWAVSLGLHFALEAALDHTSGVHGFGAATLLAYLAVTLGAQREVVRMRLASVAVPVTLAKV